MTTPPALTEARALARAVEALRAAGRPFLADDLAKDTESALDVLRDELGDIPATDAWLRCRETLCALYLVRAGYHVTPPLHADALPGGDPPPPPPPPHG